MNSVAHEATYLDILKLFLVVSDQDVRYSWLKNCSSIISTNRGSSILLTILPLWIEELTRKVVSSQITPSCYTIVKKGRYIF